MKVKMGTGLSHSVLNNLARIIYGNRIKVSPSAGDDGW